MKSDLLYIRYRDAIIYTQNVHLIKITFAYIMTLLESLKLPIFLLDWGKSGFYECMMINKNETRIC